MRVSSICLDSLSVSDLALFTDSFGMWTVLIIFEGPSNPTVRLSEPGIGTRLFFHKSRICSSSAILRLVFVA